MTSVPIPTLGGSLAWPIAASALIVGAVLLLWGAKLHRVALALTGAGAGALIGGAVVRRWDIGMGPLWGQIAGALILALVGVICARLIWALLAAGFTASVAGVILASKFPVAASSPGPGAPAMPSQEHLAWLYKTWLWIRDSLSGAWDDHMFLLLMVLLPTAFVPFLVALIRPRLGRILMTSLLGAWCVVFALLLCASRIEAEYWQRGQASALALAAVVTVLMLGGLVFQYVRALSGKPEEDEEEQATPPEKKPESKAKKTAPAKSDS